MQLRVTRDTNLRLPQLAALLSLAPSARPDVRLAAPRQHTADARDEPGAGQRMARLQRDTGRRGLLPAARSVAPGPMVPALETGGRGERTVA